MLDLGRPLVAAAGLEGQVRPGEVPPGVSRGKKRRLLIPSVAAASERPTLEPALRLTGVFRDGRIVSLTSEPLTVVLPLSIKERVLEEGQAGNTRARSLLPVDAASLKRGAEPRGPNKNENTMNTQQT